MGGTRFAGGGVEGPVVGRCAGGSLEHAHGRNERSRGGMIVAHDRAPLERAGTPPLALPSRGPPVAQEQLTQVGAPADAVARGGAILQAVEGDAGVVFRAPVVARHDIERIGELPEAFLEGGALDARCLAVRFARVRLVEQHLDVVPAAAAGFGHCGERRGERGVGGRKPGRRVEREPLERGAPPPRLGAARPRGGERVVETPRLDEIPHTLPQDPWVRRGDVTDRIESGEELVARPLYVRTLGSRAPLLAVGVKQAKAPHHLVAVPTAPGEGAWEVNAADGLEVALRRPGTVDGPLRICGRGRGGIGRGTGRSRRRRSRRRRARGECSAEQ